MKTLGRWLCRYGFHKWGLLNYATMACERPDCEALYDDRDPRWRG